jgi:hypothetical protein
VYRFELAMPPASLKANAIPGWTPAEESEIARVMETTGASRKTAIRTMRRAAKHDKAFAALANVPKPPKKTKPAPKAKTTPKPRLAVKAKSEKSGKKETEPQRRQRFLDAGICGACEKRKRAPKPASKGGGHYAECRECHDYYQQKSEEYRKAAKKGGK